MKPALQNVWPFLSSKGPRLLIVLALGALSWLVVADSLTIFDRPLSEERITAQEERVDAQTYERLKAGIEADRAQAGQPKKSSVDPFRTLDARPPGR